MASARLRLPHRCSIGGISASLLGSLAVGSQVVCLGAFSAAAFLRALHAMPQPSWYSAVPSIHMAVVNAMSDSGPSEAKTESEAEAKTEAEEAKTWAETEPSGGLARRGRAHGLRFIRSGAAALAPADARSLSAAYGGIPIVTTYSMSEQMPITQPPVGCDQLATGRHGSVGVPIVSSLAIVDPASLAPLPFGNNGVIAISGPTVMRSYLGNAAADRESFFYLSCADGAGFEGDERFFLTGDVGHLSEDGHLTISGRSKELIKRGGEQVSPHEVEEALLQHEWVRAAVVFAVPSQLWGEEVGVAIVLDPLSPREADDARLLAKAMRQACAAAQLTPGKWPSVVLAVEAQQLPTTSTGKPIRTDLAATLSVSAAAMTTEPARLGSPKVSKALDGVRYFLACQVVFNHVGYQQMAEGTWGVVAQARFFCIHVPTFFALAGFSLAIAMGPPPRSKLGYVAARLSPMLPMYLVSIALLLLNTVLMCHPASFDVSFHWLAQPDDQSRGDFCEPAPLLSGWWSSLLTTLAIYTLGLQSWPLFLYSWFLSYYTWFSSVYYALLALHPSLYARLVPLRGNRRRLWLITIVIALLNGCVVAGWVVGWARPRIDGGGELDADEEAEFVGHFSLMYYLFPPFWWPSFALGTMAAFLFDAYRPNLSHRAYLWGVLCDLISAALLLQAAAYMLLASCVQKEGHLCPSAVDNGLDNKGLEHWLGVGEEDALGSRTLAGIVSRAYLPLMVLWLYAMAVGRGLTCFVFSRPLFVDTLAPASYNVYLFHQWVGQLYYLATRHEWWSYWRFRKDFFWFSPQPVPVAWHEYFFVLLLTTWWALLMSRVNPWLVSHWEAGRRALVRRCLGEPTSDGASHGGTTLEVVLREIEALTGAPIEPDWTLAECGLASVAAPVLRSRLVAAVPGVNVALEDLVEVDTIAGLAELLDERRQQAGATGVGSSTAETPIKAKRCAHVAIRGPRSRSERISRAFRFVSSHL